MVELSEVWFLFKQHSSSGRVPTDMGFRFFVQELMDEEQLDNMDEVKIRMSIFNRRFEEESLVREVLGYLSANTHCAALCLLGDVLRHAGLSTLTDYEELRDVDVLDPIFYRL